MNILQKTPNQKEGDENADNFENNQIIVVHRNPDMCRTSQRNVKQKDEEYCS